MSIPDMSVGSRLRHAPLPADDAMGDLIAWRRDGLRAALVTLVGIEGAAPRPLGAQMAVSEDGRSTGYLSGGCLEQAVVAEAQLAIREEKNRSVRYGKDSPYLDMKLPCGSGLDLYFDVSLERDQLEAAARLREARTCYRLVTDLATGRSEVAGCAGPPLDSTRRIGETMSRVLVPRIRVLVAGSGPALPAIVSVASAADLDVRVATPDAAARSQLLAAGFEVQALIDSQAFDTSWLDGFSAAICAFHEHDWEPPILAKILATPCFYVGVLGSRSAHANRLDELERLGFESTDLSRLRGPAGSIPGAKSRSTLAIGIVAELAAEAKARGLLD